MWSFLEEQPITPATLDRVYEKLQVAGESAANAGAGYDSDDDAPLEMPEHYLKVVNAFDMPRLTWSAERNAFERCALFAFVCDSRAWNESQPKHICIHRVKDGSLAGSPESKAAYLRDRYNTIKQVILRSEHFSPPALPGHDRKDYLQVRPHGHSVPAFD